MQRISNLLKTYKDKSRLELLFHARRALEVLLPHFGNLTGSDESALSVMIAFAAAATVSDGSFSEGEVAFVSELLGLSAEQAVDILTRAATPEKRRAVDGLFDACDAQEKLLLLDFCLCFIAVDGDIAHAETEFVRKLIE